MSDPLNITGNLLKVMALFTEGYERQLYIREVCGLLPVTHGTAYNILTLLEKRGVLESVMKGKIRIFTLRKNNQAQHYCALAESYKRVIFSEEFPDADGIICRITPYLSGPAALFGSYAKRRPDENSDIDIFVAGDYDRSEIMKISRIFGIRIQVKAYPVDLFTEIKREDPLIKEVYKSHIMIKCQDFFIREIF